MIVLRTVDELRAWRRTVGTVGLVPTMGALHAGHAALVDRAAADNDRVIASIFVNPTQFGPKEDLADYPRGEAADLALLEARGCAAAFVPAVAEMYPVSDDTRVVPGAIAARLEGAARPGHFTGVATVVTKLLALVTPDRAYFGQKDFQQLRVIQTLVRDLRIATQIVGCPTVRQPDGLALSSRNAYLTSEERHRATVLGRSLTLVQRAFATGTTDAAALRGMLLEELRDARGEPDYVSCADPITLAELEGPVRQAALLLAVRIGPARLIDNALLGLRLEDLDQR